MLETAIFSHATASLIENNETWKQQIKIIVTNLFQSKDI